MTDIAKAVIAGLLILAISGAAALIYRQSRRRITALGFLPRLKNWMAQNLEYVRNGFRWQAALEYHHDTNRVSALISKKLPPEPPHGAETIRNRTFISDPFVSAETFAREVYGSSIAACAWDGWDQLDLLIPGQGLHTIRLITTRDVSMIPSGGDPEIAPQIRCLILKGDWYPFASVPQKRDSRAMASSRIRASN